jgi:hypothetical protein
MAAKESVLSALHEMLAEMFIEDIRICREEGIPMSASDKAVIVKFLKDNNISADISSEEMSRLTKEFQDELSARRTERAKSILDAKDDEEWDLSAVL